jgi:hypothetical protein
MIIVSASDEPIVALAKPEVGEWRNPKKPFSWIALPNTG